MYNRSSSKNTSLITAKFTPTPIKTDFASTWDVPFNPAKAKCISNQEFLRSLNPTKIVKGCAHETKKVKCPCGKCVSATHCIHCSITFCSETCGKCFTTSPEDEDEEYWENENEKSGADAESRNVGSRDNSREGSGSARSSDMSRQPSESDDNKFPRKNCTQMSQIGETKDLEGRSKVDVDQRTPSVEGEDGKRTPDFGQRLKKEDTAVCGQQKQGNYVANFDSEFLRRIALERNTVSYNKKLVAGRGRGGMKSRGQPAIQKLAVPSSTEDSEATICLEERKADIAGLEKSGQFEDVQNSMPVQGDDNFANLSKYLSCFPQQPKLDSLKDKWFVVTHVYSLNRIHIISCDVDKNQKDDLLDDVNDACKDAPSIFEEAKVGDLVCAVSSTGLMERGVVLRKLPGPKFDVKFIDFGGRIIVPMSDIKLLTDDLLQTPILGYEVKLENLEDEPPRMLPSEIDNFVLPSLLRKKLKMTKVKALDDYLHEAQFSSSLFDNLTMEILKFQVWDWELLFQSGLKNDSEMLTGKQWAHQNYLNIPLSYFPDTAVIMECSRFDQEDGVVAFKNIDSKFIKREFSVLQLQINRYVDTITAVNHHPMLTENFLLLPDPDLQCERYWRRANRVSLEYVHCVDTDEFFLLKLNHETRYLCPDFLKVPVFAIFCEIDGQMKSSVTSGTECQSLVENTFVEHRKYSVKVVGYDDKTSFFKIETE